LPDFKLTKVAAVLVPITVLAGLGLVGLAQAQPAGSRRISGQVVYPWQACAERPANSKKALGYAKLVLMGGGLVKTVALSASGRFSTTWPRNGKVRADIVLDSPLVAVSPGEAPIPGPPSRPYHEAPYRLAVGRVSTGQAITTTLSGPHFAGAANIFSVLHHAAQIAAKASPVNLKKVYAAWRYGTDLISQTGDDLGNSFYSPQDETIFVDGAGSRRDEWEPWILDHEYGHAVQFQIAPVTLPEGDHSHLLNKTYPNLPQLPYVEGFGTGFAADVLGPKLSISCGRSLKTNLAAVPATPALSLADARFAQFNETTSASVMWQLAKDYGLKAFLRALRDYTGYSGHYPQNMREVREAMIELEHGRADRHVAIDSIFASQNLRWGTFVSVTAEPGLDSPFNWGDVGYEVKLTLNGPYGHCEAMAKPDQYGDDPLSQAYFGPSPPKLAGYQGFRDWDSWTTGALPYTWQDECLTETSDGYIDPNNPGSAGDPTVPEAEVLFPYLAGEAQRSGLYTLSARIVCTTMAGAGDPTEESNEPGPDQENCLPSYHYAIGLLEGLTKGNDDEVTSNHYLPSPYNRANEESPDRIVTLPPNVNVPIAEWNAEGYCKMLVYDLNCSTALKQPNGTNTPF
jgi:hypothetical protein